MSATHVVNEDLSTVLTRTFDAPPSLVYQAWTDPAMMSAWWGPHGMTTDAEMDLRVGGSFDLAMVAADGTSYPLPGIFLDIVPNERLILEMRVDGHPANWHDYLAELYTKAGGVPGTEPSLIIVTRVTFEALKGDSGSHRTRLTVTQTYKTTAERDAFVEMGSAGGWSQSFEKLEHLLAGL